MKDPEEITLDNVGTAAGRSPVEELTPEMAKLILIAKQREQLELEHEKASLELDLERYRGANFERLIELRGMVNFLNVSEFLKLLMGIIAGLLAPRIYAQFYSGEVLNLADWIMLGFFVLLVIFFVDLFRGVRVRKKEILESIKTERKFLN